MRATRRMFGRFKSGTSFGSIRFRKTIPTTWRLLPKRIFPLATRFGKCPVSGIASSLTASDSCRTRKFSISSVRGSSTLAAAGFRIRWTHFLPKILRKNFYTDLKNIPVTVDADKSIHIDEYHDSVIRNAEDAFLFQTKKLGVFGADVVRSYAFARTLAFLYRKMPFLTRPLEWLGKIR